MSFLPFFKSRTIPDKSLVINSLVVLFLSICFFAIATTTLIFAAPRDSESPKRVIQVKDYKWKEGGRGRPGIMGEITLENIGKNDYENMEIEVDLYTTNDIPLGSLRSTIKDVIQSGTKKTFKNINFGIMHSDLEKTIVRVVGAEEVEKGTPGHPKDLILVKNWEWEGGQYGTEGILKEITLENRSKNNYSNIKLEVQYLGIPGAEVGPKGHTERTVIHDILPANRDRTYQRINVGFRHPEANKVNIIVTDAKKISVKELKHGLAKKGEYIEIEGEEYAKIKKRKTLAERYREERGIEDISEEPTMGEKETGIAEAPDIIESEERSKLSLAERYQSEVLKKPLVDQPQISLVDRYKQRILAESDENFISPTYTEPQGPGYSFDEGSASPIETDKGTKEIAAVDQKSPSKNDSSEEEYEDEVPLPQDDLVVRDFKLAGSLVPNSIAELSNLTIENISSITYTKIEIEVEFLAYAGDRPLGLNRITLYEVLPPHSTREFKDIRIGMIHAIPEVTKVRVMDATASE